MRLQLMVDSGEFMDAARSDIARAEHRVFVQALTFEADAAGRSLADAVLASPATDRRIAIDTFTRHKISDSWVYSPRYLRDREFRREVHATRRMVRDFRSAGVGVRFTNPVGKRLARAAARNHKKLVLVDGRVAYVGGINFSDHNFAWRDVMLRMEDDDIVETLGHDFEATWGGRNQAFIRDFPGLSLHVFDGCTNARLFEPLRRLLSEAHTSIDVHCCYLSPPFSGWLRAAQERGVRVRLLLPAANNWADVNHHARRVLGRAGVDVRHFAERMTHLKTMVIDDRALVVGSANFDFLSYRLQQEFMAIVTDPEVVRDFRDRVFEPDLLVARIPIRAWGPRERFGEARVDFLAAISGFVGRLAHAPARTAAGA